MSLTGKEKKKLKSLTPKYSPHEIADKLNVDEQEVRDYLQKKWSKPKYKKYISRFKTKPSNNLNSSAFSSLADLFWRERIMLLFLGIIIFAVYANALTAEFVSDDILGLVNNPEVRRLTHIGSSPQILLRQFYNFLFINFFGLRPVAFRLGNILFHLGTSFVLYLIVKLISNKKAAAIAAVLFAIHPIAIESVTWISGGVYPQFAFFFLLSFLLYLFSKKYPKYYKYSLLSFALCILTSADKTLSLALIFPLYEFLLGNLKQNWQKTGSFVGLSAIWAVVIFGFAGAVTQRSQDLSTSYYGEGGFYNPLIQIPAAISTYLELTVWPADLTLYHSELNFAPPEYAVRVLVTLIFFGSYTYSYFKNKKIFFFLSVMLISLAPFLTPLKIAWVVAERYFYLGLAGLLATVSVLFVNIFKNLNIKISYFVLAILAVALSVRTIDRNMDWRNQDTLWIATARSSPSDPQTHNNLGDVYSRAGDYEAAEAEFKLAIALNPNYADAYHNLALTQYKIGKIDEAVANFQKALEIRSNLWQSHAQLAQIFYEQENYKKALEHVQKALAINPDNQSLLQAQELLQTKVE